MTVSIFALVSLLPILSGSASVDGVAQEKVVRQHLRSITTVLGNEEVSTADSCMGEQLQQRLKAASRGASVVLEQGTYPLCGTSLVVPSSITVRGKQGTTLLNGEIRISGTAQGDANLVRKIQRGSRQLALGPSPNLNLRSGDWIIVAESEDLNNNDQPDKGIPQELVQVASVDSAGPKTVVHLQQSLHHPYELSGTNNESAVYKASPIHESSLRNLTLKGVDVEVGIAQNVTLAHLKLDQSHITPAAQPIAANADAEFQNIRIDHPRRLRSWNVLLELDGCSRCLLEQISTFGGTKDAIRLNGIADTELRDIRIHRAPVRSLRIYRGDQVSVDGLTIVEGGYNGGQSANIEQWLLDYTHDVNARDVRILRFFQQDAVELRGDVANVHIRDQLVVEHPTPVNDANTCMHVHGGKFTVRNVSLDGFHFNGCSQQIRLAEGMSTIRIENGSFVNARSVSIDGGRNLIRDMHHVTFRDLEIARERAAFLIRNRNNTAHDISSILVDNVHVYGGDERNGSLLSISDVQGLNIVESYFEPVSNRSILVRGQAQRVRYVNNIDHGVHEVIIKGGIEVESKAQSVVKK
ncbi:hypothetical protein GGP55_003105 [Salinibacter ruber]|uniref:hypothetical protein n=1 Tax=Salinibacter ruber TaxID=146919 RepID=UPI0021684885|nr:hypothetical protein [Salinibacter ruber]MCS3632487.1 hypothetical protein [Salinibacter ruber]